jgi:hypothetical protein
MDEEVESQRDFLCVKPQNSDSAAKHLEIWLYHKLCGLRRVAQPPEGGSVTGNVNNPDFVCTCGCGDRFLDSILSH